MGPRLGKLTDKMSGGRKNSWKHAEADNSNDTKINEVADSSDDDIEPEKQPLASEVHLQHGLGGKYKNLELQSQEDIVSSCAASGSSAQCGASGSGAVNLNHITPCASTSLELSNAVPKTVDKFSKKRRTFKASTTSSKRDFFGIRRSKKWPMMRLSSCCTKKEQELETPPVGSVSCVCTGYRRRNSESDRDQPETSIVRTTTGCNELRPVGVIPIIDLSLFNPADYPIDDEDERMRRQRAKEMAEGVEMSLSAKFGVLSLNSYHHVHTQVDYIHCLVPDLKEITTCSFYWGKIDRYEAEKLLEGKVEGTFLLRDSAQEEYLFSVSFRRYGRSLHARIEQWNYSFSFDSHDPTVFSSPTVTGLIEHYKDPSSCMFFEPLLTTPLHRNFPFDLQHLARSVICSKIKYDDVNSLPLPKKLKTYCKEYHYKQRVRVRQLE